MPDPAERSAVTPDLEVRFSPAVIARAQRVLEAEKRAEFNLPLFSLIAGLMAGRLIKRPPPKAR